MKLFICVVDSEGRGITDAVRVSYESFPRSRNLAFEWHSFDRAAVLTGSDEADGEPMTVALGDHLAVGMARLDNRAELERWGGARSQRATDLELILRTVARHGTTYVPQMLGDFAFVIWNAATRDIVAATDAFAVRKLYYATRGGLLVFASRAEALALEERYDVEFLAELVASCVMPPERSVYDGVHQLSPGALAVGNQGRLAMRTYWSASEVAVQAGSIGEGEASEICRDLLSESVRLRLGPEGTTWAQLSGGLDSSSIVSTAQWLAARGIGAQGLAGTVTYVDRQQTEADEREYSDDVVRRWRVRNETIVDPPFWFDGDQLPPRTDRPGDAVATYPRERRLAAIVRSAGGRVLLTGYGGDELFTGTMFFFADWIAHGRILPAMREMARRAAIGRASLWELAYRNAVLPLIPGAIRPMLLRDEGRLLPWIQPSVIRRYHLRERAIGAAAYDGPLGRAYPHALATYVAAISRLLDPGYLGDVLDVRYPFLYRPLVEFALRLPPELCVRAQARKWVLREAMRGILPERVRTRIGKGGLTSVFGWSLVAQRHLLQPLVREPMLADLGIIDGKQFRIAFESAPHRPRTKDHLHFSVQATLIIEAWLQMRSGRWPPSSHVGIAAPSVHAHCLSI